MSLFIKRTDFKTGIPFFKGVLMVLHRLYAACNKCSVRLTGFSGGTLPVQIRPEGVKMTNQQEPVK